MSIVNCASEESKAIVEERETQGPRLFKILTRLEQPVIWPDSHRQRKRFWRLDFPLAGNINQILADGKHFRRMFLINFNKLTGFCVF